jgi:hypothetical protein
MNKFLQHWENTKAQSKIRYKCGYCGTDTSPSQGWNTDNINGTIGYVLICSFCNRPSFVETYGGESISTTPAPMIGQDVKGLPEDVHSLYDDARKCTAVGAYTSAVLTCRKILMHVAVEKNAPHGKSFIEYVDFLASNHYVPPDGKDWVDHIRSKSNEANHEIAIMDIAHAQDLVSFTEMLLRLVYEFKHRLSSATKPATIP